MLKHLEKFKSVLPKYLVAAVIVIVPLFPKFPLLTVPGTYVAIRFEDLLLLILGIVTLIKIAGNYKHFLKDEITQAFLIFFAVNLISLISGVFLTKTASLTIGLLNYFRRVEYLIPFFAVITLFDFKELKDNLNYYLRLFMVVTLIALVYGIGQRYLAFPIIITQNSQYAKGVALRWTEGAHVNSTFAGHYDLAATMSLILPVFIILFFTLKNYRDKFWLFSASAGGLWLLINSLSRISQASYLAAVSIALLLSKKFKVLAVFFILSVILIGQSPSLKARFVRVLDVFYQKIKAVSTITFHSGFVVKAQVPTVPVLKTNLPSPAPTPAPIFEDRSTSIRLKVEWPRAIRAFNINPLLGTGYSSITLATDNDYLRMLGETGLLGFLAFVLIVVRIGKYYIKGLAVLSKMSLLEKGFVVGAIGGIVGTFIGAFFIDLLEASKFAILFWFVVAYSLAIVRNYIDEQ